MASESSCKLAARLGWLLATGFRALDCEFVTLCSKARELEEEVRTLQDAKVIVQEVSTAQAELCYEQQCTVEQLVVHIANEQRRRYGKSGGSPSQVHTLTI